MGKGGGGKLTFEYIQEKPQAFPGTGTTSINDDFYQEFFLLKSHQTIGPRLFGRCLPLFLFLIFFLNPIFIVLFYSLFNPSPRHHHISPQ
jgi:hypothetical protein